MLTLSQGLDNQREVEEREENDVEFVEAREDAAKALEPLEETFDLIAFAVQSFVILPGIQAIAFGPNHGDIVEFQRQLPDFVVFLGPIHDQMQRLGQWSDAAQQIAPRFGVGGLAGQKRETYRRSSIRGNQVNLGGPSAAGLADSLGTVFFNAPVPSGCTLTMVESSLTASIRMRTICSRCNCSNTRSSTPFLDQRFMRV